MTRVVSDTMLLQRPVPWRPSDADLAELARRTATSSSGSTVRLLVGEIRRLRDLIKRATGHEPCDWCGGNYPEEQAGCPLRELADEARR